MNACITWTCLSLVLPLSLLAAPKPLSEVTDSFAKNLPAGCIVTGEFRDSKTTFHLAGKGLPNLAPEQHLFEIGSISKVFTGLLLAQAVSDKKLSLSSTLRDLLGPDFAFADPNVAAITLEQLSTHTSGRARVGA